MYYPGNSTCINRRGYCVCGGLEKVVEKTEKLTF